MASQSPTDAALDLGAAARTSLPPSVTVRTVPEMLARCVQDCPDRIALVAFSAFGGEESLTYRELSDASARVAGGLAALGVAKGDRVGMLISNAAAIEGHICVHAAHRLGAIAVPINVRSVAREVAGCVESAGCKVLVYESRSQAMVDAVRELVDVTPILLSDGGGDGPDWARVAASDPVGQTEIDAGDGANWVFTSGTTGYPKIVAHTHGTCVACGVQVAEAWDLHPGDVYLNGHPFFTASGTNTDLMSAVWAQCTHVVEPNFDITDTLERVSRFGATTVFWMTPMLALLFASDEFARADLSTVRRVGYGGQMMDTAFHLQVNDIFTMQRGIEVIHMIGMSEAGPGGIILDPKHHRDRPGSVGSRGFSAELTEYRLVDVVSGAPVGPGQEGEICYRSPSIMQGYVGSPEATAEVIKDGWLHSGDLCRYDEDGFVFFVDRLKDVIRRGGVNIASAEVEQALRESPDIADIAAVPAPHAVLGEVVRVVVVRADGSTIDEQGVKDFAATRLADFKIPRVVDFVDELPRNDMGKVQKARLRT